MTTPEELLPDPVPAWWVYHGTGKRRGHEAPIPPPPPWRTFHRASPEARPSVRPREDYRDTHAAWRDRLAAAYRADPDEARLVNTAIHLRRPLLVTGLPGTGKSTLAYSIAYELGLGRVLRWNVTSRSTVKQALYQYDAIGRFHDANTRRQANDGQGGTGTEPDLGAYIRLGPLGTALVPVERPRVLLIDEVDKGDIDLPNDLLSVFEEGEFAVTEVERLPDEHAPVHVMTDDGGRVATDRGWIRCSQFPIVVLTSNSEREFPAAFLRRCIRMPIRPPRRRKLETLLGAHFADTGIELDPVLVDRFLDALDEGRLVATDQLLNALQLQGTLDSTDDPGWDKALDAVLKSLNEQD
jgi:MoxR-like ATPase